MHLAGKDHYTFLGLNTSGVFETGHELLLGGTLMPPASADVTFEIEHPDGFTETMSKTANRLGGVSPPRPIAMEKPGVYKVSVDIETTNQAGETVRGDVVGSGDGEILYFVVEYKLASSDSWTTVTNELQPQARYSIRGLQPNTHYELKVTAHNHAGSTTIKYPTSTLAVNYSGDSPYGDHGSSRIRRVLMGLGMKSLLLIVISSLCLVLASIGVCVCLRKSELLHKYTNQHFAFHKKIERQTSILFFHLMTM